MEGRFTVMPEERLTSVRPLLEQRMREAAELVGDGQFEQFFDRSMRALLVEGFRRAGGDEGTVWMLDTPREHLIPRFNSGPHAESFVGTFRQSARAGMISMVLAMEQPICENEMCLNARQDRTLDQQLQLETCAMLAVPFYFVGGLRGVISCVQLRPAGSTSDAPGFSPASLDSLQLTAGVLSRLIEHRLMSLSLGLEGMG